MASPTPHVPPNFPPVSKHLATLSWRRSPHPSIRNLQKVKICNSSQSKKFFLMAAILKVTNILHSCE